MLENDLHNRIRVEFLEMPGLRLTAAQVQRLCAVERTPCQHALATLVATKFLCLRPNGSYARLTEGADILRRQPAIQDESGQPFCENSVNRIVRSA